MDLPVRRHRSLRAYGGGLCSAGPFRASAGESRTINAIFGLGLADDAAVATFLREQSEAIEEPRNAGEFLRSRIGSKLTDLFFRPYTKKMWALELEEMDAAVVNDCPSVLTRSAGISPATSINSCVGMATLFERIFDHANIEVHLSTFFKKTMLRVFDVCSSSSAIDEYFEFTYGALPYRSIKFHHKAAPSDAGPRASVVNFTDADPFTRQTDWSRLPSHRIIDTGLTTLAMEEPCDNADNDYERFR